MSVRIRPSVPPGRGATGAHRLRKPGVGGSSPPVQTHAMRGGGTGTTPGSEPGGPRSNRGLAAIDVSAHRSACCVDGGYFAYGAGGRGFESRRPDYRDVAQLAERLMSSVALVLRPIFFAPVSCEGRASFIWLKRRKARRSTRHRSFARFPDRIPIKTTNTTREEASCRSSRVPSGARYVST